MPVPLHSSSNRNQLLAALSPEDLARLEPRLHTVPLVLREVLYEPRAPIKQVYFLESGMASLVADTDRGSIEIGIVGRDGLVGLPVVLGTDRAPHRCFVQAAGEAQRMSAAHLCKAMEESASLRGLLLRYAQALMVQISQTAVCNGLHELAPRLARWLLMAHDRAESDDLPLTHEFLSLMLAVRRPGITEAIGALQASGIVWQGQGHMIVLNRKRLEAAACGCYAVTATEYERLLGPLAYSQSPLKGRHGRQARRSTIHPGQIR